MQFHSQRLSQICMVALMTLVLVAGSTALAKDEMRTWSDAKGKNKIKAKFVKLEDETVTLENEDGEELEIELKKLSPADQKFATDAAKGDDDNPFKSKSDDPFKPKPKTGKKPAGKEDSDSDTGGGSRTVTVDLSSAEHVSLAETDEWHVDLQPLEPRSGSGKTKPIQLPSKSNFFDGLKGLAFTSGANAKTACVGFLFDRDAGVSRIALCDLTTGKCGTAAAAPGKMVPIAVHDDGKQVVMKREEFGFGNQDRLEVWIPRGAKVSKIVTWTPYESHQGMERDVMWAAFLDDTRLATSSRSGKVVVWQYPQIEPLYYFETINGAVPSLSHDRKLIAYSNGKDVGVFDVDKKEVVAQQPIGLNLQWPYTAFSPSGKRLAILAFDKVLVWDLATGKLERTIPCTRMNVHGSIEFPDDNFILVGNHYLIDLENQLKLWTYNGAEQVRCVNGMTYFAVSDGDKKPGALLQIALPHPVARDLLKKALTDPNLFVLKAGTNVRIDVNGIPDPAQKERVAKGLSKQLEAINCKGGTTGTIDIVASMEGPKDTKLRFSRGGEHNFKEYVTKVKLVYQGQTAWEVGGSNAPGGIVFIPEGENLEGYLRKLERPNYALFENVELPKFLQKPSGDQNAGHSLTIGQSQVTTGGLR